MLSFILFCSFFLPVSVFLPFLSCFFFPHVTLLSMSGNTVDQSLQLTFVTSFTKSINNVHMLVWWLACLLAHLLSLSVSVRSAANRSHPFIHSFIHSFNGRIGRWASYTPTTAPSFERKKVVCLLRINITDSPIHQPYLSPVAYSYVCVHAKDQV